MSSRGTGSLGSRRRHESEDLRRVWTGVEASCLSAPQAAGGVGPVGGGAEGSGPLPAGAAGQRGGRGQRALRRRGRLRPAAGARRRAQLLSIATRSGHVPWIKVGRVTRAPSNLRRGHFNWRSQRSHSRPHWHQAHSTSLNEPGEFTHVKYIKQDYIRNDGENSCHCP